MGVVPLQFLPGDSAESLGLDGTEVFSITGLTALNDGVLPSRVTVTATSGSETKTFEVRLRIDTETEAEYFRNGGVLNFVLRQLAR